MRSRKSWTFVATLLVLGVLGGRAGAQAQRPAAPPPTPPAAGGADKPAGDALAQEAEAKPKEPEDEKDKKKYEPLTGHFAAGFNFTKGNSDTRSFNVALVLKYDPRTQNVVKADAFYILNYESGDQHRRPHLRPSARRVLLPPALVRLRGCPVPEGPVQADRLSLRPHRRDRHRPRQDAQRGSSSPISGPAPSSRRTSPASRTSSGALRAGENYSWKISESASFTQNAFALWKTSDLADAYYHLDVGIGAAINDHFELKVALIDEYKRKPPDPAVKRNDVAGIVSIGYKL